ncbi:MAG: protease SohB [Gammaproteobacteria bacterium]|nr:protease SohB [Gammaproteobacteria bacterium]
MAEFFSNYALFAAKWVTAAIIIIFVVSIITSMRRKSHVGDQLTVDNLSEKLLNRARQVKMELTPKKQHKALNKSFDDALKAIHQTDKAKRVFVIDFKGDIQASAVSSFREEVTAILSVAEKDDEVLVRLENAGGLVHDHGLAASQLARLRERGIPMTVAVDKVAASGGYMMACVADHIIAAPFAVIGSIGVIAQLPNFHRLLDRSGIDFEQVMAGKHKRSVTFFGENTDADRAKLKHELEELHTLFKSMVSQYRPQLDIEAVATGESWFGQQALPKKLIDEIGTSDDYLLQKAEQANVYRLHYQPKCGWRDRMLGQAQSLLNPNWFAAFKR